MPLTSEQPRKKTAYNLRSKSENGEVRRRRYGDREIEKFDVVQMSCCARLRTCIIMEILQNLEKYVASGVNNKKQLA